MLYIRLDTNELLSPFKVDRDSVRAITQKVVEGVAFALYQEINEKASNGLSKTRAIYLRNLNLPVIEPLKGTIILTGSLPNMLEQGATAFDMKEGMLRSAKVKNGKSGPYLTIPFRWASAGSIGENEAFSGVLPSEIQSMLKNINSAKTIPTFGGKGSRISKGDKLDVTGTKFDTLLTRKAFTDLKTGKKYGSYLHKSPIYQGIQKESTFYGKALQSQYMSFRRISLRSAKNSWVHPGFVARNFFEEAYKSLDINTLQANIIDKELEILGF